MSNTVPMRTLNILWLAMLATVPVVGIAGWLAANPGASDPETVGLMSMVLPVLALVETAVVVVLPRFIKGPYHTTCIIRWALAESIGVYGLVLLILGGSTWIPLGLMGWSFLLIALLGPSREALERSGGG